MGIPSITIFSRFSDSFSTPMALMSKPVGADTGATQFTRMSGASSTARPLVNVMTAPFDALYGVRPLRGRRPPIEAVLTMAPPGAMWGTKYLVAKKIGRTFTVHMKSNCSVVRLIM